MMPFKKGAFHMAIDAGMDILPIVISQYDFLDAAKSRFEPGRATVRALKPISVEGYGKVCGTSIKAYLGLKKYWTGQLLTLKKVT